MKNLSDEQFKYLLKNSSQEVNQDEFFVQKTVKKLPKGNFFYFNIGFHIFLSICLTIVCIFFSKTILDITYSFIEKKITLNMIFSTATYISIMLFLGIFIIKKLNVSEP